MIIITNIINPSGVGVISFSFRYVIGSPFRVTLSVELFDFEE